MKKLILLNLFTLFVMTTKAQKNEVLPSLNETISSLISEFAKIPEERKNDLKLLAEYIQGKHAKGEVAQLTFICTHNSRRSHMSQIWAATAAAYYGVDKVATFSGGTEATAFNKRAIKAMQQIGFQIDNAEGNNPHYQVKFATNQPKLECFSKKYDDAFNPQSDFCAVMTCAHADETCPIVRGADDRVSLPYDDPKAFDGTPMEAEKYHERSLQIGRELFYAFSLLK